MRKPLQHVLFDTEPWETAWESYKKWCKAELVPKNAQLTKLEHFRAYRNHGDTTKC